MGFTEAISSVLQCLLSCLHAGGEHQEPRQCAHFGNPPEFGPVIPGTKQHSVLFGISILQVIHVSPWGPHSEWDQACARMHSHNIETVATTSTFHLMIPNSIPKQLRQNNAPNSRSQSLHSTLVEDKLYSNVDTQRLYESVLKVVILKYVTEARFYTPLPSENVNKPPASQTRTADLRKSRLSRMDADWLLPPNLVNELKTKLNMVAMKKTQYDDLTRRLLLRFYGELLDPQSASEIRRVNSVDMLVMKFVSASNKEVVKLGLIPPEKVSLEVFKQTEKFVKIMILLVQKEKNSEALVAKLNEHMASLKPKLASVDSLLPLLPNVTGQNLKYPTPSFKVNDMDQGDMLLLQALFGLDVATIQQDVERLKGLVTAKTLHKDVEQVLFYLGKNIGKLSPDKFSTQEAYLQWKDRETAMCEHLTKKYVVHAHMKLLPIPAMPAGEEFYIMPSTLNIKPYFVTLLKLCLLEHRKELDIGFDTPQDVLLFSNRSRELMLLCARVWRLDYPTRAVCLFTAAHMSELMIDPLFATGNGELGPIDLNTSISVFETCKRFLNEGGLDWDDKMSWSSQDQTEWVSHLGYTYSEVFHGIKECLTSVVSKTSKPKFGPYLSFLGDYVESDTLFPKLAENGITTKWERKLTRTLMRTAESSYAELLKQLPRDDTLSIIHILETSDALVDNVRLLQKRYKSPLLGFLNVGRTYAAVVTGMFAADALNILKHIAAHVRAKGEFLNYGDTLEAYKSLKEIRSIHLQVSPGTKFGFNLEKFFFPYLESWVKESTEKIKSYVIKAVEEDKFEPVDPEADDKKYSSSVHDIFTLIKHYLNILKDLGSDDTYELARIYTLLIKSISESCLFYANEICEIVAVDLAQENEKPLPVPAQSGWLKEVKSMVSNIHGSSDRMVEEPFNFSPRTCIGLNNLSAVKKQLSVIEERLDPEKVSNTVSKYDPQSRHSYTSHVFSIRIVKAENLRSSSDNTNIRPYMTLIDTQARKTIAKTQTSDSENPEWDEEFEITLPANSTITLSATVWEEKFGTHGVCGRALIQLQPRKFKHDGIPQEIYLDLDNQGRILVEIAVESERDDALFAMGRAHRSLKRSQQRITKMIVGKFSNFIKQSMSRQTLKSVCGSSGNIKPTEDQMDEAMTPLYNYLNMNLLVLAQYLSKDLLLQVMLEAWNVVVSSADELLLPKLTSASAMKHSLVGFKSREQIGGHLKNGWQSAVSSAMANVTNSINSLGFGKTLTANEIETVIGWLNFLCIDFFHNQGNGPPVHDLKSDKYQSLLLIPVYYDRDVVFLKHEVEMLSPAFVQTLRDKNNVYLHPDADTAALRSRAGSIARSLTIRANATARARANAAKEAQKLLSDPLSAQTSAEDIILRLLLVKDEKQFVAKRMEQREQLAHTIATERLAKAAAEGQLFR